MRRICCKRIGSETRKTKSKFLAKIEPEIKYKEELRHEAKFVVVLDYQMNRLEEAYVLNNKGK